MPVPWSPFGQPSPAPTAAPMPAAPMSPAPAMPPAPVTPPMAPPSFQRPQMPSQGAPGFGGSILPILASVLASGRHPAAIGSGMAAYVRGKRLKQAEQIDAFERQRRDQMEAAEFQARMIQQANTFDDPIAFESWRQAIAPMADVYGVPVESITFNQTAANKKTADKRKSEARAIIDQLRKSHGDVVDDPEWRKQYTTRFEGNEQAPISSVYAVAEMPTVKNGQGLLVGPQKKTDEPADLSKSGLDVQLADAMKRAAKGEPGAADDVKRLEAAILKGDTLRRDPPRITVNTGANENRTNTRIDRITTSFQSSPLVKEFNEVQAQEATIRGVVSRPWSGPGDMSIIFGFMKALDPNSVVRETEYANASKSGNIFTGWAAKFNGMISPNGGFLSEQVKRSFLVEIQARLGVKRQQYDNLRRQTAARIDRIRSGAPETGDEALIDFGSAIPGETPPQTPAPLLVGPKGAASRSRVLPPTTQTPQNETPEQRQQRLLRELR